MRWENERKCALVPQLMACVNTHLREIFEFGLLMRNTCFCVMLLYFTDTWDHGGLLQQEVLRLFLQSFIQMYIFWGVSRTDEIEMREKLP